MFNCEVVEAAQLVAGSIVGTVRGVFNCEVVEAAQLVAQIGYLLRVD